MTITIEWWHVVLAAGGCAALGFGVYAFTLYRLARGFW